MRLEEDLKTNDYVHLNVIMASMPSMALSCDDMRILDYTTKVALTSLHSRYRVGATLLSKHRVVLASAVNSSKTHPVQAESNVVSDRLHAEVDVILRARRVSRLEDDMTLVIVNINARSGLHGCSFPCIHCHEFLRGFSITRVLCYNQDRTPVRLALR